MNLGKTSTTPTGSGAKIQGQKSNSVPKQNFSIKKADVKEDATAVVEANVHERVNLFGDMDGLLNNLDGNTSLFEA